MDILLTNIIYLCLVLLAALLCHLISSKTSVPAGLLLIMSGLVLKYFDSAKSPLLPFSNSFLFYLSVIVLTMVVFDATSKLRFRKFDTTALSALKLSAVFFILNSAIVSITVYYLFSLDAALSLLFGIAVSGIDIFSMQNLVLNSSSRIKELLRMESIFSSPLVLIIAFSLIGLMQARVPSSGISSYLQQSPIIPQFIIAIGAGLLIGFSLVKLVKYYSNPSSTLIILLMASLLTYIFSQSLGGNGAIAVATVGLIVGNVYRAKDKNRVYEHRGLVLDILTAVPFVLIGYLAISKIDPMIVFASLTLFIISLLARLISTELSLSNSGYSSSEKKYISFNMPQGAAIGAIVFYLVAKPISGFDVLLPVLVLFTLFSILFSLLAIRLWNLKK